MGFSSSSFCTASTEKLWKALPTQPNIPLHDKLHRKQKSKYYRAFNSLVAGCFHFSALCKGKASVRGPDEGLQNRKILLESMRATLVMLNVHLYHLRLNLSSVLQGHIALKVGQLLLGPWERRGPAFRGNFITCMWAHFFFSGRDDEPQEQSGCVGREAQVRRCFEPS